MLERNVKEGQQKLHKTKREGDPEGLLRVTNLLTIAVFFVCIKLVTAVIYAPSSRGVAHPHAFT